MRAKQEKPQYWSLRTLNEALAVLKDGTHFSPKSFGGKNLYITSKNIRMGRIDLSDICYIPDHEHKRIFSSSPVQCGDVLLTKDGANTGNVCINSIREEFSLLSSVAFLRGKAELLNNDYLLQWLSSPKIQFYIKRDMAGQAITRLTLDKIGKIPILLPTLPEQKAIADLLSTWDAAIEKTERLIWAKEKQLRLDSNWMLFGHRRVHHRETKLVHGQFFRYPIDWQLVKINSIAKEVSLRNANSNERVLSCSKHDGFVNSLDYFGKQVFSSDTSNYKVIKKGQFGFPSNHIEEGSIGLLEHCEKGIVSPIYIVFKVDEQKVYSQYLYRLFKTNIFQHIFQINTSSSVDRRGSLRWSEFSKIEVPLPKLDEQKEIADNLFVIQKEINLLKKLCEKYKLQKRGLMQKLLSGEWRIKSEIVNQYAKE